MKVGQVVSLRRNLCNKNFGGRMIKLTSERRSGVRDK